MPDKADHIEATRDQYATAKNLDVRSHVHAVYSTNKYGWSRWLFDNLDFPEGARILELGCGHGGLWATNIARVRSSWDITLSDSSPGMLEAARKALACTGRQFRFVVADAQAVPFPDAHFNGALANHMLYCLSDVDKGIREIRRVLTEGGRLYAATNGADHMRELRELVRSLAPELPFVTQDNAESFGLENGLDKLARHFRHVEVRRYEDALDVPDVAPLVDWVMSTRRAAEMLGDSVEALRGALAARLARDGRLHVTKSPGLFIAW